MMSKKKSYMDIKNILSEGVLKDFLLGLIKGKKGLKRDAAKLRKKHRDSKGNWDSPENEKEYLKLRKIPSAWKQLNLHKQKIQELEDKLAKEMEDTIDTDVLSDLVGGDNARQIMKGPGIMVSALTFSSTLRTSNGLDVIEHNHQEIKDGKYESHTDTAADGTPNLKNWKLTWRAWDGRAGGLIASFNSERENM